MTTRLEEKNTIHNTRFFLQDLLDPKKTPRVPKDIRERARRLLKHYPITGIGQPWLRTFDGKLNQ